MPNTVTALAETLKDAGPWGIVAISCLALVFVYRQLTKKDSTILQLPPDQLKVNMEMLPTLRNLSENVRAATRRESETTLAMTQMAENLRDMRTKMDSIDKTLGMHCAQDSGRRR